MNNFAKMFREKSFVLIVSIPKNCVEMAQAAKDGGADCIKVHTSTTHTASGNTFPSLDEERDKFLSMINDVRIPTGVVPGKGINLTMDEVEAMDKMGFLFVDNLISDFSPRLFRGKSFGRMAAITPDVSYENVSFISSQEVDVIEADVVSHDKYGFRISLEDLIAYNRVVKASHKPVIVPTQKKIMPEDIVNLMDCGVRGLMIGVVVTGEKVQMIRETTEAYRNAIDAVL